MYVLHSLCPTLRLSRRLLLVLLYIVSVDLVNWVTGAKIPVPSVRQVSTPPYAM